MKNVKGKAPAFQFYPMDWMRDLEEHPLEVEGAWIRLVCKLWWSETRGALTRTLTQWSKVLRESEEKTLTLLHYLQVEGVATINPEINLENLNGNGLVTIISRRMVREEKAREATRLRVQKHRQQTLSNEPVTPMKHPSSTSTSTSKKKENTKRKTPLPKDFLLTKEMIHYAVNANASKDVNATKELFTDFCIHHRKVGSQFSSWVAAWQNWCRNEVKFRNEKTIDEDPNDKTFTPICRDCKKPPANGSLTSGLCDDCIKIQNQITSNLGRA